MVQPIPRRELLYAQAALFVAIALQIVVWGVSDQLLAGLEYFLIPIEIFLAVLIGFSASSRSLHKRGITHALSLVLLALISVVNAASLVLVLYLLVVLHHIVSGPQLLTSAIAIFITNIIVFTLWYWEIDSPGLSGKRWSKNDKDFQFTQQDMKADFPHWRPAFIDYLYLSVTNAVNFAPADVRPITHAAKVLMGSQSLISVFTLALVIARSVSILGQ